jgi:hypothetical protein
MTTWLKYYYCVSCGRPYCQSETKKGNWVPTSDTGSCFHSVHCMSCSKMIHQPGLLPTILLWVVCVGASPVSFARWISSGEQIELMITVFCGVGGLLDYGLPSKVPENTSLSTTVGCIDTVSTRMTDADADKVQMRLNLIQTII